MSTKKTETKAKKEKLTWEERQQEKARIEALNRRFAHLI
jgi:hypothetical protein